MEHEVVFQEEGSIRPSRRLQHRKLKTEESALFSKIQIGRGQTNRRVFFLILALVAAIILWVFLGTNSSSVTGKLIAPTGYKIVAPLNEPPRLEKK